MVYRLTKTDILSAGTGQGLVRPHPFFISFPVGRLAMLTRMRVVSSLSRRLRSYKPGFTLVELLVVIAIIGVLVAILLPAVQSAREAARRNQCRNNLKQLALGANNHLSVHKFFPVGGWGWGWAGDPNYGYDLNQPSGWMYTILPFIEEGALHSLGKGLFPAGTAAAETYAPRASKIKQAIETPVSIYFCPTRRTPETVPFVHGTNYVNATGANRPKVVARNDYVACAGSVGREQECYGPSSYNAGKTSGDGCWRTNNNHRLRGITVMRGTGLIGIRQIKDGVSKTILYSEKYQNPSLKEDHDNDQGWNLGYDRDVIRWNDRAPKFDYGKISDYGVFGSAHASGLQAAFADASVHTITYDIDDPTFIRLGDRSDGLPVSLPD
jgi:prepilin-type N-terminal cleavage/methylation domain-containing protein